MPPPLPSHPPSSDRGKHLSGSSPRVYAVLDVGDPGVLLQGVDGFQDVLAPVLHLREQPSRHNAEVCTKRRGGARDRPRFPTLSTNVLSLSGISSGMVVRTSTMADRGMLTLAFED